jgi:putative PIN family toxin of toxin-antitoxin system
MRVVIDTSVLVAAARSRNGASFALVQSVPTRDFEICLSVALFTEWQDVLTRPEHVPPGLSTEDVFAFLEYLASQAHLQDIHFLWRPCLPDPDDDLVLELAFAGGCPYIITHNARHYRGSERFGIAAVSPREFLRFLRQGS